MKPVNTDRSFEAARKYCRDLRYQKCMRYEAIAEALEKHGFLTVMGKTTWAPATVWRMINADSIATQLQCKRCGDKIRKDDFCKQCAQEMRARVSVSISTRGD